MADTPTREELHAALQTVAIKHNFAAGFRRCRVCRSEAELGEALRHAPDCLAAPDALTKGDEHER